MSFGKSVQGGGGVSSCGAYGKQTAVVRFLLASFASLGAFVLLSFPVCCLGAWPLYSSKYPANEVFFFRCRQTQTAAVTALTAMLPFPVGGPSEELFYFGASPSSGGFALPLSSSLVRTHGGLMLVRRLTARLVASLSAWVRCPGDPLMHKLAAVVAPMKSSFIVAHLRPRKFVTEMQVSMLVVDRCCFFVFCRLGLCTSPAEHAPSPPPGRQRRSAYVCMRPSKNSSSRGLKVRLDGGAEVQHVHDSVVQHSSPIFFLLPSLFGCGS